MQEGHPRTTIDTIIICCTIDTMILRYYHTRPEPLNTTPILVIGSMWFSPTCGRKGLPFMCFLSQNAENPADLLLILYCLYYYCCVRLLPSTCCLSVKQNTDSASSVSEVSSSKPEVASSKSKSSSGKGKNDVVLEVTFTGFFSTCFVLPTHGLLSIIEYPTSRRLTTDH